jgi:hypothetical protein
MPIVIIIHLFCLVATEDFIIDIECLNAILTLQQLNYIAYNDAYYVITIRELGVLYMHDFKSIWFYYGTAANQPVITTRPEAWLHKE